ncbi:MAG: LA2681 family HEPN domain-containing protein [Chloroflexota bacterium]|nr:LA2681 family HEPN domain-containing protein [Chloroflexota bacterium]
MTGLSNSTIVLNALYRLAETDLRAALERMAEYDAILADDFHYAAFRPGVLINAGCSLDDPAPIQDGIHALAAILDSADPRMAGWRTALLYNLGNGYAALAAHERRTHRDPDSPLLQRTKWAYRDAIAAGDSRDRHLQAEICTNYGNALSNCGRHYEALLAYDQALRAEPTHAMAMGNKGIELERYAHLAPNQSGLLLAEAYELCRAAAGDKALDRTGLASARAIFAKHRDGLEPVYVEWQERLVAARSRGRVNHKWIGEEEHHHRFAADHGLYLNLCVHDWPCSEQHTDALFFSYVSPLSDPDPFPRLARYFNQAKEDYATARYLLAEAQRPTPRRERISDWTSYADLLEYAEYGLTPGLVKAAYATAYNVLDKIAVFLKWDLGLPEAERTIDFKRVWRQKNAPTLRPEIAAKGDPSLFALYDISLDLRDPGFERLGAVRHAITHRHLVVHDWLLIVGENSTEDEHIRLDELIERGIELLRLVKAALIYLAAYLSQDQERKTAAMQGLVPPLPISWQHQIRGDR